MRQAAGPSPRLLGLALLGLLLLRPLTPIATAQTSPDRGLGAPGGPTPAQRSVPRIARRAPSRVGAPSGSWLGQDGHDFAGSPTSVAGNDVQDIHVLLRGLPAE